MTDLLLLAIGASLVNAHLLTGIPGLCPLTGLSSRLAVTTGLSLVTLFAVALAVPLALLVQHLLLEPHGVATLAPLVLVLLVVATVVALDAWLQARRTALRDRLGAMLPFATVNAALCGLALLQAVAGRPALDACLAALPLAALFGLAPLCLSAMHDRLSAADTPAAFRGLPLAFVTAGLAVLALMGLGGILAR